MKHDRIEQKKENPQATEAFKKLLLLSFTLIFYIIKTCIKHGCNDLT